MNYLNPWFSIFQGFKFFLQSLSCFLPRCKNNSHSRNHRAINDKWEYFVIKLPRWNEERRNQWGVIPFSYPLKPSVTIAPALCWYFIHLYLVSVCRKKKCGTRMNDGDLFALMRVYRWCLHQRQGRDTDLAQTSPKRIRVREVRAFAFYSSCCLPCQTVLPLVTFVHFSSKQLNAV